MLFLGLTAVAHVHITHEVYDSRRNDIAFRLTSCVATFAKDVKERDYSDFIQTFNANLWDPTLKNFLLSRTSSITWILPYKIVGFGLAKTNNTV